MERRRRALSHTFTERRRFQASVDLTATPTVKTKLRNTVTCREPDALPSTPVGFACIRLPSLCIFMTQSVPFLSRDFYRVIKWRAHFLPGKVAAAARMEIRRRAANFTLSAAADHLFLGGETFPARLSQKRMKSQYSVIGKFLFVS